MPHYLWLSVGISSGSAQPTTVTSWLPTCSPAGCMQAVLLASCLSSCGQSTVLGKGTPTPGCHLHRQAELVALCSVTFSARMDGNWDCVAVTGRIHAADGGADGDLSPWCCKTGMLQAQEPWLWAEAGLWAYSPLQHHGESYSLPCRKVCATLINTGKNNGRWGAVTLPQPPSYWENRIKYKYFLWRMKVKWKPSAFFLIIYIEVYNCRS